MSGLDKVLRAAAGENSAVGDPGTDLVAAAAALLDEALVVLAWDPDGDGDDDSTAKGDTDHDFKGKSKCPAGVKGCDGGKMCKHTAPKGKGGDDGKPSFPPKKNVKATVTAAVAAARLALSGLSTEAATSNWVQATSVSAALALSQASAGAMTYADPGFQKDGRARYPLDAERIHTSLASFAQLSNRSAYTPAQVDRIWASIKTAAVKQGVGCLDTLVALAAPVETAQASAMNHAPFTGKHSHAHHTQTVVTTAHHHNDDNRHGGRGGYGSDW